MAENNKHPADLHFGTRYVCKREDLMMGDVSDDDLANAQFLCDREDLRLIHLQTAAKDRIRWLSRQLAKAETANAELLEALREVANDFDGLVTCGEFDASELKALIAKHEGGE